MEGETPPYSEDRNLNIPIAIRPKYGRDTLRGAKIYVTQRVRIRLRTSKYTSGNAKIYVTRRIRTHPRPCFIPESKAS